MYGYNRNGFFFEMGKVLVKAAAITLIICAVALIVTIVAIGLGLIFWPKTTLVIIGLAAVMAMMLGLCKAAASGNIYCPSCGSENHKPTHVYQDGDNQIARVCNDCGHKW